MKEKDPNEQISMYKFRRSTNMTLPLESIVCAAQTHKNLCSSLSGSLSPRHGASSRYWVAAIILNKQSRTVDTG
jgi:hypothetical protein